MLTTIFVTKKDKNHTISFPGSLPKCDLVLAKTQVKRQMQFICLFVCLFVCLFKFIYFNKTSKNGEDKKYILFVLALPHSIQRANKLLIATIIVWQFKGQAVQRVIVPTESPRSQTLPAQKLLSCTPLLTEKLP